MKAGKVRKKSAGIIAGGNGYIGIDRRGNNAGGSSWAGKCLCGYKQL